MADIPFLLKPKRALSKALSFIPADLQQLAKQQHPTRRQMTLRLGTCFENPYGSKSKAGKDELIPCPFSFESELQVCPIMF